jgi:hypothetical protein
VQAVARQWERGILCIILFPCEAGFTSGWTLATENELPCSKEAVTVFTFAFASIPYNGGRG